MYNRYEHPDVTHALETGYPLSWEAKCRLVYGSYWDEPERIFDDPYDDFDIDEDENYE